MSSIHRMTRPPQAAQYSLSALALALSSLFLPQAMAAEVAAQTNSPEAVATVDGSKGGEQATAAKQDKESPVVSDTIVVTGTSVRKKKFETPYAISTINEDEIQRNGPKSTVDLLKSVPGVKVENSGGEGGGENVVIRGLPFSGFRLMDLQEDGLPLFESNFERQLQIDELYRVDLGTSGAEIVRGGTAPIYSNNASGGVINFLSNFGTETPEHAVKLTVGQDGLVRTDVATSGPINEKLLYSFSGFYRQDNGLRDPGFSGADKGGQFKFGTTYLLDDDKGKLFADFKYLNDRSIFYSAIPLTNPIDGTSLSGLINPSTGTLDSNSFRNVNIRVLNGNGQSSIISRDLADGIHPDVSTLTMGGNFNLEGGWKLTDKARYSSGKVDFNALLNGAPSSAATLLSGYLAGAKKVFAGTTSLQYVYAGSNNVFNPATTGGLAMTNTWQTTTSKFTEAVNDFRVDKTFDLPEIGTHDVTAGLFVNRFTLSQQQLGNTLVTDVKSNPDALDIQALNASGQVTGMVTENGFSAYGSGDLIGDVHGLATALYGAENWHINKDWQADIGVRHEVRQEDGERGVIGNQTVSSTGPLAAQTITGLTGYVPYSNVEQGTSWTLGSLYQIFQPLNTFVRYTSTYSLPRLSDYWANYNNGVAGQLANGQPVPVTPIRQAEAGLKFSLPNLQLVAIGFMSNFKNLNSSTYVANSAGILSSQPMLISTTTEGIEFEGFWHPAKSSFEFGGSLTLQKPIVDSADTFNTIYTSSISGKQIPRTPKYMATFNPSYLFVYDDRRGRLFTTLSAIGQSYQDYTNTSILSAYGTVDMGVEYNPTKNLKLQVLGTNLTNSTGLTEGNARAPAGNVINTADATTGRPIFGRYFLASATYQW